MENDLETPETARENDAAARPEPAESRAWRLPLTLTLVSLLIWFGFQTAEQVLERSNLIAVKSNYDAAMQEAEKMRAQLEALVTKTAELASKGNPNAKAALEELQKRGIPVSAGAPPVKN
jgi:cell division protein FtsB